MASCPLPRAPARFGGWPPGPGECHEHRRVPSDRVRASASSCHGFVGMRSRDNPERATGPGKPASSRHDAPKTAAAHLRAPRPRPRLGRAGHGAAADFWSLPSPEGPPGGGGFESLSGLTLALSMQRPRRNATATVGLLQCRRRNARAGDDDGARPRHRSGRGRCSGGGVWDARRGRGANPPGEEPEACRAGPGRAEVLCASRAGPTRARPRRGCICAEQRRAGPRPEPYATWCALGGGPRRRRPSARAARRPRRRFAPADADGRQSALV